MYKRPLQSKKFIAYLIADFGWKIAIFYMLFTLKSKLDHYTFMFMTTLIIISGFIQVGYILGQAALDRYVEVTKTISNKESNLSEKDKKNES